MLRPGEILIGETNWRAHAAAVPDGQSKGLVPRDYSAHPRGSYDSIRKVDFPVIPRAEWSERCRDKAASKTQLSDLLLDASVPCLDQNGRGYCWAHSTVGAMQATRAVMGQPTIGLSAYSVACKIKGFRDEGGWGAQSAEFIAKNGVCDETVWPQRGTQRSLDTPAAWENAKQYVLQSHLADMQIPQYDRNMAFEQYATCWLLNDPTVDDHNWWGHSIFGCDLVDGAQAWGLCRDEGSGKLLELREFMKLWAMDDPVTAGFGGRIRNSWGAGWGAQGFGVLAGSKAIPDGGVGILLVTAS